MDSLVTKLIGSLIGNHIKGDDFVDRLYYHVTAAAFLLLAVGSGYMLYAGDPVECSLAGQTSVANSNAGNTGTGSGTTPNEDGLNAYCLARQLLRPDSSEGSRDGVVMDFGTAFFKWAPLVFVVQAFLFKLPNMLWARLIASSTKELETVRNLVEEARELKDEKDKRLKMDQVVVYFETWVTGYKTHKKLWVRRLLPVFFCCGKQSGSYLSSLYISMKILNFLVLLLCAFLLIGFFDGEFFRYGLSALDKIYSNGDWEDSVNFPKMLLCEYFVIKGPLAVSASSLFDPQTSITNQQMQYAQCAMSINFFLEKVFLLEWFWFVILGCVTIFNICVWVGKIKQPFSTIFFVKDYMETIDPIPDTEDKATTSIEIEDSLSPEKERSLQKSFVGDYLRSDGVFLLRLLEVNSGRAVVGELVISLFKRYKKIHGFKTAHLELYAKYDSTDEPNKNKNKRYASFWKHVALGKILPRLKAQARRGSTKDRIIPEVSSELGENLETSAIGSTDGQKLENEPLTCYTARPTTSSSNNIFIGSKENLYSDNIFHDPSKETNTVNIISETDLPQTPNGEEKNPREMEKEFSVDEDMNGKKIHFWNRLPFGKILPNIKKKLRSGFSMTNDNSADSAEDTRRISDEVPGPSEDLEKMTFDPASSHQDQGETKQNSANDRPNTSARDDVIKSNVPDVDLTSIASPNDEKTPTDFDEKLPPKSGHNSPKQLIPKEGNDSLKSIIPEKVENLLKELVPGGETSSPGDLIPKEIGNSLEELVTGGDGSSKQEESQSLSDAVDIGTDC